MDSWVVKYTCIFICIRNVRTNIIIGMEFTVYTFIEWYHTDLSASAFYFFFSCCTYLQYVFVRWDWLNEHDQAIQTILIMISWLQFESKKKVCECGFLFIFIKYYYATILPLVVMHVAVFSTDNWLFELLWTQKRQCEQMKNDENGNVLCRIVWCVHRTIVNVPIITSIEFIFNWWFDSWCLVHDWS